MKTTCAFVLTCLCLAIAAPARAGAEPENTRAACTDGRDNDGDGHVDCADQDCQELAICVPATTGVVDDVARMRGRGTMRVVVGAVLLSLGIVVGGSSAALWIAGTGGSSFSYNADQQAAVAMDVVGVAMMGAGTAVLALGAGDLAATRRTRVALSLSGLAVRF
jgi:hypothetical protein